MYKLGEWYEKYGVRYQFMGYDKKGLYMFYAPEADRVVRLAPIEVKEFHKLDIFDQLGKDSKC